MKNYIKLSTVVFLMIHASTSSAADGEPRIEKVRSGDTLAEISYRVFGTHQLWRSIYQANRDKISSPTSLEVGTSLRIPEQGRPATRRVARVSEVVGARYIGPVGPVSAVKPAPDSKGKGPTISYSKEMEFPND